MTGLAVMVQLSFGASYALAVHEILDNFHEPPTMAKYLEIPMLARMPFLAENVSRRMAAGYAI